MGADLITIGYTIDDKKMKAREVENPLHGTDATHAAENAVIYAYLSQIREHLATIDYNGYLDAQDADEDGFSENGEDVLANCLYAGWTATLENYRHEDSYDIPGTDNVFIVAGGTSWGDDPFEGYSDLALLLAAINKIPALGLELGILGTGIRL